MSAEAEDQYPSITLTGPENLIAHIQGLQATLTQRNATIAQLQDELGIAANGEPQQKALNKAYRNGWQACAMALEAVTRNAALQLGGIRKNALDVYYEGEKL